MKENDEMRELADNLASYIWDKHIAPKLARTLQFYRARVTAVGSGKMTVQKPFDEKAVTLPFVGSAAGLSAGDQCIVLVLGSHSNSIIIGDGTLSNL